MKIVSDSGRCFVRRVSVPGIEKLCVHAETGKKERNERLSADTSGDGAGDKALPSDRSAMHEGDRTQRFQYHPAQFSARQ